MILAVLIAALFVARFFIVVPERGPEPMPQCMTCGAKFLDGRGVDWHRAACHPHVDPLEHDEGSIARWNR